jgi:hypothetical protein
LKKKNKERLRKNKMAYGMKKEKGMGAKKMGPAKKGAMKKGAMKMTAAQKKLPPFIQKAIMNKKSK